MEATAAQPETNPLAPCECAGAGYCSRFKMRVNAGVQRLCATNEKIRLSLARKAGLVVEERPEPPPPLAMSPCIHRSKEPIAREPCLPCQGKALVDVFGCSSPFKKWGRCTIETGREVAKAHLCDGCRARVAPPMDALWFFRHSVHKDEELRYSLRSVARFAPWLRTLYILGDRPAWLLDSDRVVHVPWEAVAPQHGFTPPIKNGVHMFVCATSIPGLSERFLSFSDDFILLRRFSPEDAAVNRYMGEMPTLPKAEPDGYRDFMLRTRAVLESRGLPTLNFDCHVPMEFTKERVLAAYADLREHVGEEEGKTVGIVNKVSILNHGMAREGFKAVRLRKSRVGWWRARPGSLDIVRAKCERPASLFLNFDDGAYGPEIADYLAERFPEPASWERRPSVTMPPKPLHVHVVRHSGWVIGRIADAICCERTTVGGVPDPNADVNLYVHYRAMREPVPGTLNVAWFTHLEDEERGVQKKRREFFDVAERADWCLAMSEGTARHLPPEKTSVWVGAPDREFVKRTLRLGVAVKPGPRKGLEKLDAIRDIPGIEIVETGGKLPQAELPDFIRSLDYLVITSDVEGGPYSVIEAIAAGKPVIAPDVGFCWDYRTVTQYDGTAEDLRAVVQSLRFPLDPWADASRNLEAILRDVIAKRRPLTPSPSPVLVGAG